MLWVKFFKKKKRKLITFVFKFHLLMHINVETTPDQRTVYNITERLTKATKQIYESREN